jgi:hypothetical protein
MIVTFVERSTRWPPHTALAAKNRVLIGGTSGLGDAPTSPIASAKGERIGAKKARRGTTAQAVYAAGLANIAAIRSSSE